jgi:CubicO group peptidase (beta-lactamase class C family)
MGGAIAFVAATAAMAWLAPGAALAQIGIPVPSADTGPPTPAAAGTLALDMPGPPARLPTVVAALERQLMADVAADGVGSVAAAVVVGDSVIWQAAFGLADRDAGILAAPTTLYRAGSISKPVTALVLLALVERGVVALDDPVARHLPELLRLADLSPHSRHITFRDLAAHTAGLAREPSIDRAGRGPVRDWRRKLMAALPATSATASPGAGYAYSNVGYALLGLALERAAGRPYEELVQELVLNPLGMTSSYLEIPRAERRRLAAGYVNPARGVVDPRVPRAEHRGRGYRVPNDGLYSTVGDLARLAMAMTGALGDTPITTPSRHAALTDQSAPTHPIALTDRTPLPGRTIFPGQTAPAPLTDTGYGLGFQLHRIGDTLIAGHSGTVAGYTAYLAFDPATGIGIVLLRNYNRGATNLGATAVRTLLEMAEHR